MNDLHRHFMSLAIKEAKIGILKGDGGPFGSIIVKNNKIIGKAHNTVLKNNDPTCHGEIQAIRSACKKIKNFDLSGSVLYSTGEPCPMCLCACMWANIKLIYFGCTLKENEKIGFRDMKFSRIMSLKKNKKILKQIMHKECWDLFKFYLSLSKNKKY